MRESATAIVARALDIQADVGPDDDMLSLPAWTSLTHVKLIMELEATLGRELTGDEIGTLDSVKAVATLIERRD
mgnify:CR=1 FL=1